MNIFIKNTYRLLFAATKSDSVFTEKIFKNRKRIIKLFNLGQGEGIISYRFQNNKIIERINIMRVNGEGNGSYLFGHNKEKLVMTGSKQIYYYKEKNLTQDKLTDLLLSRDSINFLIKQHNFQNFVRDVLYKNIDLL